MRQLPVGELVFDFAIYPRVQIDIQHVRYMTEALAGGTTFPPPIIDIKSKRIVDGFHRCRMYSSQYGPEHEVEVIEKKYRNDAEMLADAIRYNAQHGRMLSRYDRVHCLILAEKLELTVDETAKAMGITVDALNTLRMDRIGKLSIPGHKPTTIALKATIRHMKGETLTPQQQEVNKRLGGMNQLFYVNQLVDLIENDLLDKANESLMMRLKHLGNLIRNLKISSAA